MAYDQAEVQRELNNSGLPTRRSILQAASGIAAATLVRANAEAVAGSVNPVMATLSDYMAEARNRAIPEDVSEKAKHHILDTFAAMISGSQLKPGRAAIRFAESYGGKQVATVVASKIVCGPFEAALANGVLAHADETDDSHAPSHSHPGCGIVSAAMAAGEQCGVGGTQFLRSVVLGYDVGPRVMMTLGGGDFEAKTHRDSHSIANTFGAAAAAACAFSLSAQQMRWVLDYAAQQTSGIAAWQRDKEHIEKAFVFGGMTARDGVTAALLVHSGWTGVDDIFSGSDNFLLANAPQCDPRGIIDKLGERYEVTRTNIKKWTVGSPIQASLDALELLMKDHHFTADQVKRVIVRVATREAYIVNNREMPSISLQHMIAVMLVDGTVSFKSAEDKARMQDPAILRQRAKVQLVSDDELERRLPRREATVEVILTDNSHFSQHVDAVRGTAENPMTRDEIVAKSRDLIAPVLGADTSRQLIQRVLSIDEVKDIRELRTLLQPA